MGLIMNYDAMRVEAFSESVALRQRHVTACGMPTSVEQRALLKRVKGTDAACTEHSGV